MHIYGSDKKIPEGESLIKWFISRTIRRNKNVILPVVGNPGSGKSYSCLRLAEKMEMEIRGKPYNIKNCCRTVKEFFDRINSGELRRGDVLILEEAGVNISAREWQSQVNKMMIYLFQTFRNLHLVCLINLPDIRMLDVNVQRLIHGKIVTKGINFETKTSRISFKIRQHSPEAHKDYWKYLRIYKNGKIKKISRINLNIPSPELIKVYEERRDEFTNELNKKLEAEIFESDRKKKEKEEKEAQKRKHTLGEDQIKILSLANMGLNVREIAEQVKKSSSNVYMILKDLKERDFFVPETAYMRNGGTSSK